MPEWKASLEHLSVCTCVRVYVCDRVINYYGDVIEPKMNFSNFRCVSVALCPLYRTAHRTASGWSWRSVLDVLGVKQPSKDQEITSNVTAIDQLR